MIHADKILILGKDPLTNSMMQMSLQTHADWRHCVFETFQSFKKALAELMVSDYDCVLVDCPSLENSPLEILIQIRALKKNTLLVLVNQPSMEKTAIHCLKHGADYYLIKEAGWEEELPDILMSLLQEHEQKTKFKQHLAQLEEENKTLRHQAIHDGPTLFYSKQHFNTVLSNELKRASRHGFHLACLVLELTSHSKSKSMKLNLNGVVEELACFLKSMVRSCDVWARLKENRFAALLPHTTARQAQTAMKRLHSEITTLNFKSASGKLPLKINWGLAHYDHKKTKTEKELLKQAETVLGKYSYLRAPLKTPIFPGTSKNCPDTRRP